MRSFLKKITNEFISATESKEEGGVGFLEMRVKENLTTKVEMPGVHNAIHLKKKNQNFPEFFFK